MTLFPLFPSPCLILDLIFFLLFYTTLWYYAFCILLYVFVFIYLFQYKLLQIIFQNKSGLYKTHLSVFVRISVLERDLVITL